MNLISAAVLVVAALTSPPVSADYGGKPASVKSQYGQLVTSSTLRWQPTSSSRLRQLLQQLPEGSTVQAGSGNSLHFACRAEHHGSVLAGRTTSDGADECAVAFVNRVHRKDRFEVLTNVAGSARLEWKAYAKFSAVPVGAVAGAEDDGGSGGAFVGRTADGLTGSIGVLPSSSSAFGTMVAFSSSTEEDSVAEATSGEVLVEVEPERYELDVKEGSRSRPKVSRSDVVLAKSSLFRFDEGRDREARLQKVLSYDYEKSDYYGQIPGMIRALPAVVTLPSGESHHLLWGLPDRSAQRETLMVGHALRHHAAVDVSVVGVRVTEEHAYSATLTTVYRDGKRRTRWVEGVLQRRYLNNIRPEYSRVYKIKESIHVPANRRGSSPSSSYSYETSTDRSGAASRRRGGEGDATGRRHETEMLRDGGGGGGGDDGGGNDGGAAKKLAPSSAVTSQTSAASAQWTAARMWCSVLSCLALRLR